ncbi:MAG: hypothetical protein ACOYKE_12660 [Ferruginibacter sp.]
MSFLIAFQMPFKKRLQTLLQNRLALFLLKLIVLVILWRSLYVFVLQPARIPDAVLTRVTTIASTKGINYFFNPIPNVHWISKPNIPGDFLMQAQETVFYIGDFCNGLDTMIIYLGFIIVLPYPFKRKLVFGLVGIILLYLINIIRIVMLFWVFKNYPAQFDIDHHYIFTIIMHLFVLLGWFLFIKSGKK